MKKIAACIFLLLSFATRADTLYQVEIIVFARESTEADAEENWSKHAPLRYPAQTIALQNSEGTSSAYRLLPADALQLSREKTVIAQRRNMRVLAHMGWLQPLEDPNRAKSIFVSGGRQVGSHHELEGTFTLGVEHFLQANANLWLSRFAAPGTAGEPLPAPPGAIADEKTPDNTSTAETALLQEQRRMRSGELHYFDHPKLGLLVLVTKKADAPPSAVQ